MRRRELQRLSAKVVPGEGLPQITPLRSGWVNHTYRVSRDGADYALRVAGADSGGLGRDPAWESRVLGSAGARGIAPRLVYCDCPRGILLTTWVEGRSWQAHEARLPENIAKLAQFLRRVHTLAVPDPPRRMSPAAWVDYYGGALRELRRPPDPGLHAAAAAQLQRLAAIARPADGLCHGDLHTLNVLDCGRSLLLLDWEYAHCCDPLWDLAGWSANNDFGDEPCGELLRRYLGAAPEADVAARYRLLTWLYDYVCLLWSELYLCTARGGGIAGRRAGIAARARLLDARLRLAAH